MFDLPGEVCEATEGIQDFVNCRQKQSADCELKRIPSSTAIIITSSFDNIKPMMFQSTTKGKANAVKRPSFANLICAASISKDKLMKMNNFSRQQ